MVGQYLGNDLLGIKPQLNDAAYKEYRHFRQQDKFTKFIYMRTIVNLIRSIQN